MNKYLLVMLFLTVTSAAVAQDSIYCLRAVKNGDTLLFKPGHRLKVNYNASKGLREITTRLQDLTPDGIQVEGFQGKVISVPIDSIMEVKRPAGGTTAMYIGGGLLMLAGGAASSLDVGTGTESTGIAMIVVGGGLIGGGIALQNSGKYRWVSRQDGWQFDVIRILQQKE